MARPNGPPFPRLRFCQIGPRRQGSAAARVYTLTVPGSKTPEERIYEEEKIRAEARDKIAADKKAETEQEAEEKEKGTKTGCLVCLIGFLAFIFLGELHRVYTNKPPPSRSATEEEKKQRISPGIQVDPDEILKTLQEEVLSAVPANRKIVGKWLDERPFISSRITIFHEGGKLYVEQVFTDGSGSLKKELVEKRSPLGRRFDQVEAGTAGDHWIIDSRGNLQLHDNDGLITTLRKIAARKAREQERVKRTVEERAESSPGVISDRFELHWELDGTDLLLAIDTDLPDEGELSVSVSRTYYEVGSDVFYLRDYFSEFEPVSRWREPRRIALDADAWKADLTAHQNEMAALGNDFAFEVARIEDSIKIRAVLHMNQDDPRFGGHGNPNLSGEATSRSGNRILVEAEASIPFPL